MEHITTGFDAQVNAGNLGSLSKVGGATGEMVNEHADAPAHDWAIFSLIKMGQSTKQRSASMLWVSEILSSLQYAFYTFSPADSQERKEQYKGFPDRDPCTISPY